MQMVTVLNLDSEAELAELWALGTLRLSAAEARQVAALRVEFRPEKLGSLK